MYAMKRPEYADLRSRLIAKQEKLRNRIDRDTAKLSTLDRDIAALERVWKLFGDGSVDEGRDAPASEKPANSERGSLLEAIRAIIGSYRSADDFTSANVREDLQREYPEVFDRVHPSSIPSTLKKLTLAGEIELVRPGAGRRPGVYMKPVAGVEIVKNPFRPAGTQEQKEPH